MTSPGWKRYVARLCTEAWELDATATDELIESIAALAATEDLTDGSLEGVLLRAGIPRQVARLAAPGIRVSIQA